MVSAVDRLGKPIKDGQSYRVVILDFMYTGGDGYTFKEIDTSPEDTGLSWREPVMRELRTAESMGRSLAPQGGARNWLDSPGRTSSRRGRTDTEAGLAGSAS